MPRFFLCPHCAKNNKHVPLATYGESRVCPFCKSIFFSSQISIFQKR